MGKRIRRVIGAGLIATGVFILVAVIWVYLGTPVAEVETKTGEGLVDSDGKIPIESVCHPNAGWPAKTGGSVLRDADSLRVVEVRYRIEINDCRLRKLGAGPRDRDHVIAHERAHARGWDHWEGTPWTNAAFFPRYRITGR
jgi:hypothetical protein